MTAAVAFNRASDDSDEEDYDEADPITVKETELPLTSLEANLDIIGHRASVVEQQAFTESHPDLVERLTRYVGCTTFFSSRTRARAPSYADVCSQQACTRP